MDQMTCTPWFFRHPLNQAMLKGGPLSQYDPQKLAMEQIDLANSGQRPTEEQVAAVRAGVIEFCKKVHGNDTAAFQKDVDGLNETWSEMHDRFANSLGLTQMMLDYGVNSRYFYQYLYITGIKFYGLALVAKDGRMPPVSAGKMESPVLEKVPEDDWMYVVDVEEPSHAGRRVTDGSPQTLLRGASKIFDGGCGLATAYWNYDYPLGQLGQEIVLCDHDERLRPYLLEVFQCDSLEELKECYGVTVIFNDLMAEMSRPEHAGKFSVVRLTGLLSYFPDPADKQKIMELAKQMLAPGGVIVTDEWVAGLSLARTALTGLWPIDPSDPHALTPAASVDAAVSGMDAICKAIGLPYVYMPDYCNGNSVCWTQEKATPKCVLFLVGDAVSTDMFDLIDGATAPVLVSV